MSRQDNYNEWVRQQIMRIDMSILNLQNNLIVLTRLLHVKEEDQRKEMEKLIAEYQAKEKVPVGSAMSEETKDAIEKLKLKE